MTSSNRASDDKTTTSIEAAALRADTAAAGADSWETSSGQHCDKDQLDAIFEFTFSEESAGDVLDALADLLIDLHQARYPIPPETKLTLEDPEGEMSGDAGSGDSRRLLTTTCLTRRHDHG